MRRWDPVGEKRQPVKEMRAGRKQINKDFYAICQELGEERIEEGEREKDKAAGHDQSC